MSAFVKKCILSHLRRMALLIFGIAVPVSLLIMLIGMIAAVLPVPEILVVGLCGCGAGCLIFASTLLQTFRFVRMIRRQEALFGCNFSSEHFISTSPKATRLHQEYFSSGSWYMCEGCWAFHRRYITTITQKSRHIQRGRQQYIAHVKTIDGKTWKLYMKSASELKKFYAWW